MRIAIRARTFQLKEKPQQQRKQSHKEDEAKGIPHNNGGFVEFELVVHQQVEDQDGAEHIKDHPPQTARIDVERFPKREACSGKKDDGENVVDKGRSEKWQGHSVFRIKKSRGLYNTLVTNRAICDGKGYNVSVTLSCGDILAAEDGGWSNL